MATAAPTQNLPLFYKALEPLNVTQHGKMKVRADPEHAPIMAKTHAVPLTVDEFTLVQRHYPIVFSVGDDPIPLALMGLNEGVNVFLDEDGRPRDPKIVHPGLYPALSVPSGAPAPGQRRTFALLRPDRGRGRRVR